MLRSRGFTAFVCVVFAASCGWAGETLYNGIELPDQWPPQRKELTREPMPVPYLKNPPKVIPIDVGRQLFVDDRMMTLDGDSVYWVGADDLDPPNPDPRFADIRPELYSLSCAPYESLMLGMFAIWTGPSNRHVHQHGGQKRNDVLLGFSRDGFHWDRPWRERFIACSWKKGTWNFGNVQPVGGCCLVVGDTLYFYVSGRADDPSGQHGQGTTGLAILRRDGFASMGADKAGGALTTRPVTFTGKHLFANVDCRDGQLQVEVLDEAGKTVEPFAKNNCVAISTDSTLVPIRWKGAEDLSGIAGRPVRFRFHLRNGSLYSFWVSRSNSGASRGYVAAGGPGFVGPMDSVGGGHD